VFDWSTIDTIPGWLTPHEAAALYRYAHHLPDPALIIEIGSYYGRSTACLAQAVMDRASKGLVVSIDHHQGSPEIAPRNNEIALSEDTFSQLRSTIHQRGLDSVVAYIVATSGEASRLGLRNYNMVFIDGDHRLEAVARDAELWLPHLAPEGIAAFHDYRSYVGPTAVVNRLVESDWMMIEHVYSLVFLKRK